MTDAILGQATDSSNALSNAASPPIPGRTFRGYCDACGTWDDHGSICVCCGYAFTAEPRATGLDDDA